MLFLAVPKQFDAGRPTIDPHTPKHTHHRAHTTTSIHDVYITVAPASLLFVCLFSRERAPSWASFARSTTIVPLAAVVGALDRVWSSILHCDQKGGSSDKKGGHKKAVTSGSHPAFLRGKLGSPTSERPERERERHGSWFTGRPVPHFNGYSAPAGKKSERQGAAGC